MSDLSIVLILVLPVIAALLLVSIIKKRKKQQSEKAWLAHLAPVMQLYGFNCSYQKQLGNQLILLDEASGQLLLAQRGEQQLNHTLFQVPALKPLAVTRVKETISIGDRTETVTTRILLEFVQPGKALRREQVVFYDHLEHNVLVMQDQEKEAIAFQKKLSQIQDGASTTSHH